VPTAEVARIRGGLTDGSLHPRDAKRRLAREIVTMWHGASAAAEAEAAFDRLFVVGDLPGEIPDVALAGLGAGSPNGLRLKAARLLVDLGLAASQSDARRLISQGGVEVDGQRLNDAAAEITARDGMVVRVGKRRFARIRSP
jgi:tyrosyl-tRNA synthetase